MFLELQVCGLPQDKLSWILCKHPDHEFELKMGGGRTIRGKWIHSSAYQLTVDMVQDDNGVAFLREMRKRNKSFYVNATQSAVAPYTVVCIRHALKNALGGKHGPEALTHANTPYHCSAVFGPWTVPLETVSKFMKALDLKVTAVSSVNGSVDPGVYHLESISDLTVTHFLQRLYVSATVLTHKQHVGDRWEWQQKLDSLALYTSGWQHLLSKLPPWTQRLISHSELTQDQLDDIPKRNDRDQKPKATMHERRHTWIINTIVKLKDTNESLTVVDYGCSSGKLSRQLLAAFPTIRLYAADVTREETAARIWRHRSLARATFVRSNLLYPVKLLEFLAKDQISVINVLVLTEVIEHLEPDGRADLVRIITDVLRPTNVLITTPNRAYNVNISKLCANGFRHSDHRIEFVQEDWEREVVTPFCESGYDYQEVNLWQSDLNKDEPSQEPASFCALFTLAESKVTPCQERWLQAHRHMRDTIFKSLVIPGFDKKVTSSTLAAGVMTPEFVASADSVFYRAPTLAPVEHYAGEPDFLEHPRGAYDYYRQRGVTALWAEHKYMGSRAHMLVFINQEAANKVGWRGRLLTIISRSGRDFFCLGGSELPDMPPLWLPFLQARLTEQTLDFAILDAEVLPWSLKAGKLIEQEFMQPGQCALVSRSRLFGPNSDKTQRAQLFLDALSCYTKEVTSHADIQARVFDVIACGQIDATNGFTAIEYGDSVQAHRRYALIDAMCDSGEAVGILPVERMFVDLKDEASMQACTQAWLNYTALPSLSECLGGEGFVFKTHPTLREKYATLSGKADSLVQPALKVRGRDYLRLIYGMDYLMPECFAIVKCRKVSTKRLLALKQTLLGRMILDAFLAGDTKECMRCQAAFCGEGHCCVVDATL